MKVVIIGASTAGLYTAYLLSREGVEVELYERNTTLGPPRRTLIVTHKLNEILGYVPEEAVFNKIKYIEVFSRSRSMRLELRKPDLVVEREKILLMLFRLARQAGAKIAMAHEFEDFTQDGKKVGVRLKNLETGDILHTYADILVGADGYQSSVGSALARQNGNNKGKNDAESFRGGNGLRLTALFQARVALPAEYPDISTTRAWFDANLTSYFIWLIPESKYTAALGTIAGDAESARTSLLRFLDDKKFEPFEFQSAMAPVHSFNHKGSIQSPSRNIFTVGDAAGQVKATTIGGLVPGLRGGEALSSALLNGRHYHRELRPLKRELDLHLLARSILNRFRNDDYDLNIMTKNQSLFDVTVEGLRKLETILKKENPDILLVQGDTTTTLAASLAAYYLKIKIAHIEAGLRTKNKYNPFPEEMNRRITDCLADWYFTPTEKTKDNLISEGFEESKIFVTGNTIVDSLLIAINKQKKEEIQKEFENMFISKYGIYLNDKRPILVTGHRRESFGKDLESICLGLKKIARNNHDVQIIYPVHLNPNVKQTVFKILGSAENIHLIEPLEYFSFVWLMNRSHLILTDSGGIQEEAPSLGKPVLVLRKTTERMEGIEAGTAKLVGTDSEAIFSETTNLLEDQKTYETMSRAINPYGDGNASERICKILEACVKS